MKKVLVASAFAVLGVVALSSCKKDYTCSYSITSNGSTVSSSTSYTGLSKSEAKAQETLCTLNSGTWAKK